MRKILVSLIVLFVSAWSSCAAFAKNPGEGPGKQKKEAVKVKKEGRTKAEGVLGKTKEDRPDRPKRSRGKQYKKDQESKAKKPAGQVEAETAKGERKAAGKGKGFQQQAKAFDRQLAHEENKHQKRLAKFKRISELAEKAGKTKTVERVNKLLAKEQQRYERKQLKIQRRIQRMQQKLSGEKGKALTEMTGRKAQKQGKGKGKRKTDATEAEKAED